MHRKPITTTILALALLVLAPSAQADTESDIVDLMASVNAELEAIDADVRLEVTEYLTAEDEQGRTVFFSDVGNKQLGFDFVPGDPRRVPWSGPLGTGDDITWASDTSFPDGDAFPLSGGGLAATQGAISSAMATWQGVNCSGIPLSGVVTVGNIGFLEFMFTGGASGSPVIAADIVHGGFGTPVDALLPPPVIAAAFTFVFVGPPDIDNNGKIDVALKEIYYTRNFLWDINGNIDVETVALHEVGHGLSQAHFGKLARTDKNGKFHFAPRAVMNAGYTGPQQQLAGSDNGGHCSNWASWPNN